MQMTKTLLLALAAVTLTACAPTYKLVKPGPTAVGDGGLMVTPTRAWNSLPGVPRQQWEEAWTLNGPLLESVTFVSGLPEGKALVKQRRKADAQVPVFRADMTPNDLVSMVEAAYRVAGITVFNVDVVDPTPFLAGTGLRMRYHYAPGDGIGKQGSCVLRVVGNKLYLMRFDGVNSHYFAAAQGEFDQMVAGARLQN
jgi:hypothetical protein